MKQLGLLEPVPDRVELAPANPVKAEIVRRHAAADRVLARLQEGPCLNTELVGIAMNLTARISELRQRGYHINATCVSKGLWRYELVGQVQGESR